MMYIPVEDMTKRRNDLQQKLKHFPTDSLRAKVLKDTVVEGIFYCALWHDLCITVSYVVH